MVAKSFSVSKDEHDIHPERLELVLQGELTIHELDELRNLLDNTLEGGQEVDISLAKVRFIDTAALQLLIVFKKRFEPEVKLRICAVSSELENILSLCGLKTALL